MRALIVYFSWSGNTRRVAEVLHEIVGGELFELRPVNSYPHSYRETVEVAKKELWGGHKPALRSVVDGLEKYDLLFIGSPNWCGTLAPIVSTFLTTHDLSGKFVAPFFTHGGGGASKMFQALEDQCPRAKVLTPLVVLRDGGDHLRETLEGWFEQLRAQLPSVER